jgi:flagella basal body P-ring formation protein FlgA
MNGEALADGGVGQRIPVRNVSSGKRLEAIVRSAGTVEVPR